MDKKCTIFMRSRSKIAIFKSISADHATWCEVKIAFIQNSVLEKNRKFRKLHAISISCSFWNYKLHKKFFEGLRKTTQYIAFQNCDYTKQKTNRQS